MKPVPATPSSHDSRAILCGTDFSSQARGAADVAAALAERLRVPLHLVHGTELPAYPPLHKRLATEANRLRKRGILVEDSLLDGPPAAQIILRAASQPYRLVVVGSHGKRAPQRWWLGSVSERVAERTALPTLVVRSATPFLEWTQGKRPLKVFVAFNQTATSEAALKSVRNLRDIGPCDLTLAYIDWPPEQRARLGLQGPAPLVGNPPEAQAILERDVRARAVDILGNTQFELVVEANWGCPDSRLAEMAREQAADLVIVGSHQYHGFERLWHRSVSRGLLHATTVSVLVVPMLSRDANRPASIAPFRRVLVATDFSDLAGHAVPLAYSLLGAGGAVRLVHVAHPKAVSGGRHAKPSLERSFKTLHAQHLQECSEALHALEPAQAANRGIVTEFEVTEAPLPAEGICQAAERFGADAICLGTHGRTGITKALLGSVAHGVMTQTHRPVLLVQNPQR